MSDGPRLHHLQCPGCGGQLDLPTDGVVRCPFCDARSLLWDGALRSVACWRLPPRSDAEAAKKIVETHLRQNRFEQLPALRVSTEVVRYLARPGRVRTRPLTRESDPRPYEKYREGLFGIPIPEGTPGAVLYVPSKDVLERTSEAVPPEIGTELQHFEFRLERAIEEEAKEGMFSGATVDASWTHEVYVVDVPVAKVAFDAPDLAEGWVWGWAETRPDGHYGAAIDLHTGTRLRWEAPRKRIRPVVLLAVLFGIPLVVIVVSTVISVLAPLAIMVLVAILGALGA